MELYTFNALPTYRNSTLLHVYLDKTPPHLLSLYSGIRRLRILFMFANFVSSPCVFKIPKANYCYFCGKSGAFMQDKDKLDRTSVWTLDEAEVIFSLWDCGLFYSNNKSKYCRLPRYLIPLMCYQRYSHFQAKTTYGYPVKLVVKRECFKSLKLGDLYLDFNDLKNLNYKNFCSVVSMFKIYCGERLEDENSNIGVFIGINSNPNTFCSIPIMIRSAVQDQIMIYPDWIFNIFPSEGDDFIKIM